MWCEASGNRDRPAEAERLLFPELRSKLQLKSRECPVQIVGSRAVHGLLIEAAGEEDGASEIDGEHLRDFRAHVATAEDDSDILTRVNILF